MSVEQLVKDLADHPAYVIGTYVIAFIPWFILGAIDNVDKRWRRVRDLVWKTWLTLGITMGSSLVLFAYIVVQLKCADYKEGMAAIVVFLAAWIPVARVARQFWIIYAARDFAALVSTLPDLRLGEAAVQQRKEAALAARGELPDTLHRKVTLEPTRAERYLQTHMSFAFRDCFNSSNFFDNDSRGDGVSDVSVWGWVQGSYFCWRAEVQLAHLKRQKKDKDPNRMLKELKCAQVVVSHRLRAIIHQRLGRGTADRYGPELVEDEATRLAWMFGNIMDKLDFKSLQEMAHGVKLIHFALLVRIGFSAMLEFETERSPEGVLPSSRQLVENFRWLDILDPSRDDFGDFSRCAIGRLPFSPERLKGVAELNVAASPVDYAEAHRKLPAKLGTTARHVFHRWEETAYFMSSTLELHAFKIAMVGADTTEPQSTWEQEIWTYVGVAYAVHKRHDRRRASLKVGGTSSFDENCSHAREVLQDLRLDWHEITEKCAALAVLLADAAKARDTESGMIFTSHRQGAEAEAAAISKEAVRIGNELREMIERTVAACRSKGVESETVPSPGGVSPSVAVNVHQLPGSNF